MDNPPPSSASRPAGYAAIALASAAGVIAASRMGRPALVLAAGLALAWWKKHQQTRQTAVPEAPPVHKPAPVVAEMAVVQEIVPEYEAPVPPPALPADFWQPLETEVPLAPEQPPSPAAFTFEPPPEHSAVVFETPPPPAAEPAFTFEPPPTPEVALESPPPTPSWLPEVSFEASPPSPPVFTEPEPEAPTVEIEPAPPISFPVAPVRNEAPLADAWNDLRAALNPSLLGKVPKISDPLPPLPDTDEAPPATIQRIDAPEMPEMYIFPPSSPLLDTLDEDEPLPTFPATTDDAPTVPLTYLNVPAMPEMNVFPASAPLITGSDEEETQPHHPPPPSSDSLHYFPQPSSEPVGEIPDEIHLPGMTDEETAAALAESGFLVTDPPVDAEPTTPQFVHAFVPPTIVSKMDPAKTTEPVNPPTESGKPLTAPIVVPREAQVKKSFFDWLRS